jgi:hypothetical protein
MKANKHLKSTVILIACILCGMAYFKLSQRDLVASLAFTFGLSGILLSYLRQSKD